MAVAPFDVGQKSRYDAHDVSLRLIDWVMLEYHACPTLYDHVMLTCPMMFSSILREPLRCEGDARVQPRVPQDSLMRGDDGGVVRPPDRLVLDTVVYHDPDFVLPV